MDNSNKVVIDSESFSKIITSLDKSNFKLYTIAVIAIVGFCLTLCIVSGFYFLGKGYPDTKQMITKDAVMQETKKGGG